MRIGVICSSNGSALLAAAAICPAVEFHVITDRACGVEHGCADQGIACTRIDWRDKQSFSAEAAQHFSQLGNCEFVIMFFSRLVTAPLVGQHRLLNIHPSLLPGFKGIGAVSQAYQFGSRFLGATLHIADEQMDHGQTIAQASCPTRPDWSLDDWQHIAFLQKTALLVLAIELTMRRILRWEGTQVTLDSGWQSGDRLNPMLTDPSLLAGLRRYQRPGVEFL